MILATEAIRSIVGVGASAGGLEALDRLLRSQPLDDGITLVIVTHRSESQDSILEQILSRVTSVPVSELADGTAIEANRTYVMPPRSSVTVKNGRFVLRKPEDRQRQHNPVDIFFDSLGSEFGERAVGVVLSGGGSDGALGIKTIKAHGGLTIAQGSDGSGPRQHGMPDAAIATGAVDLVIPVEEMPGRVNGYVRTLDPISDDEARNNAEFDKARARICSALRNQVGHDFSGYKERTFMRRVHRRMQVLHLGDADSYADRLAGDPDEVVHLFRDLLIGVTSFFRDAEVFETLATRVIPAIFEGRNADDAVRIWIPGCATGEEAYSIAMLVQEHMDGLLAVPRVQIFATDIDDHALAIARRGRYPVGLLQDVDPERRQRFFAEEGGMCEVDKSIRDLCMFSLHSVIRDPPFSRMDLVSCRNLLIYMDGELQDSIFPIFHYSLREEGFLLLGTAENLGRQAELFSAVDKKARIFQKRDRTGPPVHLLVPTRRLARSAYYVERQGLPVRKEQPLRNLVEAAVLDRFAPSHVVVDGDGDVVLFSSRTGIFLEAPAGLPNRHILALARPGLRLDLRTALQEAAENRRPVRKDDIAVEIDDRIHRVRLQVEPLNEPDHQQLYLIVFTDLGAMDPAEVPAALAASAEGHAPAATAAMARELRDTRERLQGTIEEYETALEELKSANEELMSVNEEMQSSNEELETSKEELQSVNEELHTVNQELNAKVDDLDRANSDLRNVFEGTNVATVFLDEQRVIRTFTPAARSIFRLITSDIGRPLTDIVTTLDYPELFDDIKQVLETGKPMERNVGVQSSGCRYLTRLLPYLNSSGDAEGIVATFIDITDLAEAEQQLRTLVSELNHRVRNMLAVVSSLGQLSLPRGEGRDRFVSRLVAMGRTYDLLSRETWKPVRLDAVIERELQPFANEQSNNWTIEGPAILLQPEAALALGLIMHELTTNAAKYGSLSRPGGKVALTWSLTPDKASFVLVWEEIGGPEISSDTEPGFGQKLIVQEARHTLRGEAQLDFGKSGMIARFTVPLAPGVAHTLQE